MLKFDVLELLVWLAKKRGEHQDYQKVIDFICTEYGFSQADLPTYWKCGACGGRGMAGDSLCPVCGGPGNDLTPMLQPWLVEDEEEEED